MLAAGDGAGGAGEVERDGCQDEPGGVGVESAGWQVGEGGALEVREDLLDDGVAAVGPVRGDGVKVGGGEERVETPDVEQGSLFPDFDSC